MILNEKKRNLKFLQAIDKYKVKCKYCGHSILIVNRSYCVCDWCGHKVYRSKKDEFKDKLKKEIKNENLVDNLSKK